MSAARSLYKTGRSWIILAFNSVESNMLKEAGRKAKTSAGESYGWLSGWK